ncbi:LuxR family transcriptional regulator [Salmonella enterica]|nr:LuxR family transcriptional regulator [Salmonella enterica]EEI5691693.1 LuxR family transcriptional regulator [Salmonella enterica]EGF4308367.1 LuxR family transcriptional regulator [Salmonella enterica]
MSESQLNTLLAEAISSISSTRFTLSLMRFLKLLGSYDNAVILGYAAGKHPVYLFDSLESNRHLLFQQYLTSTFQQDPFYRQLLTRQEGVFSLKQVIKQREHQDYLHQFYLQTGWQDELCLLINIGAGRDVLIFLGVTNEKSRFTADQLVCFKQHFAVIKALCQQHWQHAAFNLAQSFNEIVLSRATMRSYVDESIQTFAQSVLTKRQQQIASLLVQGLDSSEVSAQLGLSIGTVKNYRKQIYAQLHINSLGELFQLFLNHLLTHAPD